MNLLILCNVLLVLTFGSLLSPTYGQTGDAFCRISNGTAGLCVHVTRCPNLQPMLSLGPALTSADLAYLKDNICGRLRVCCTEPITEDDNSSGARAFNAQGLTNDIQNQGASTRKISRDVSHTEYYPSPTNPNVPDRDFNHRTKKIDRNFVNREDERRRTTTHSDSDIRYPVEKSVTEDRALGIYPFPREQTFVNEHSFNIRPTIDSGVHRDLGKPRHYYSHSSSESKFHEHPFGSQERPGHDCKYPEREVNHDRDFNHPKHHITDNPNTEGYIGGSVSTSKRPNSVHRDQPITYPEHDLFENADRHFGGRKPSQNHFVSNSHESNGRRPGGSGRRPDHNRPDENKPFHSNNQNRPFQTTKRPQIVRNDQDRPFGNSQPSYGSGETTTRRTTVTPGRGTSRPPGGRNNLLPNSNECGRQGLEDKIVGGNSTGLDEYPWMVLLEYQDRSMGKKEFSCGGVLISSRYVLTAAHCLTGPVLTTAGYPVSVRLGEYDLAQGVDCVTISGQERDCNNEPVDIPIESIHPHEKYHLRRKTDDIGLVRLRLPAPTGSDFIRPICLPDSDSTTENNFDGNYFIAGWGATSTDGNSRSNVKMHIKVLLADFEQCKRRYKNRNTLDPGSLGRQFCAGGRRGQDACSGDSGGPVMRRHAGSGRWTAEGVVSFGPRPCAEDGLPAVYTKVYAYRDWIEATMRP